MNKSPIISAIICFVVVLAVALAIQSNALVFLLFIAGVIALQIFLSKRESKWAGLVLPVIAFLFGFLYPLNMTGPAEGVTAGLIAQMIIVLLIGNIPTFVFLAIYIDCRGKLRHTADGDSGAVLP